MNVNRNVLIISILLLVASGCSSMNNTTRITGFPRFSESGENAIMSMRCNNDMHVFYSIDVKENSVVDRIYPPSNIAFGPQYLSDTQLLYICKKDKLTCPDFCKLNLATGKTTNLTDGGFGGKGFTILRKKGRILFSSPCQKGNTSMVDAVNQGLSAKYDLFSINQDGTGRTKLTDTQSYYIGQLSTTNDNSKILFYRSKYKLYPSSMWFYDINENRIYPFVPILEPLFAEIAREKSTEVRDLAKEWVNNNIHYFYLSPNGESIVFAMRFPYSSMGSDLYLAEISSRSVKRIADLNMTIRDVAISPNGNTIFIVEEDHDGYWNIWRIEKDGSGLLKIIGEKQLCGEL